ncbi:MAG: hypothetical protein GY749_34115 [Desulfobacteraceae bacterium]|nr:hypothetical protein [Desulfobacteraceae bacterium]
MKLETIIIIAALLFCIISETVIFEAEAGIMVLDGLTREKVASAGETFEGFIEIRNTGKETEDVKVYQTDYLFYSDGSNSYDEPGTNKRSNAKWLFFSPHQVTIPPGGTSRIIYNAKIPGNKALKGSYWSILMVEAIPKESPESGRPLDGTINYGLTQVFRYGVQMITHIGDTGTRKLNFLNPDLLKDDKNRILQIDIENTGERYLQPSLWTKLYDEKGGFVDKFEGGKTRTYPGTSVRFKIDLSKAPAGNYKAIVVADCGGDDIFGATYSLKFEE